MRIPRIIHQVWIGPLPPPVKWMSSWTRFNPSWEYMLWDNEKVFGKTWRNQRIIDTYVRRYHDQVKGRGPRGEDIFTTARGKRFVGEKATLFAWHVIADVIRYEILFEHGGYMPGADSVCRKPIDHLFEGDVELYTVNTGHLFEQKYKALEARYAHRNPVGMDALLMNRYHPDNASPILASAKKHPFLDCIIDELARLDESQLNEAVDTTGNVFMGAMIRKYRPTIKIVPYRTQLERQQHPTHSIHFSGTTKNRYHLGR